MSNSVRIGLGVIALMLSFFAGSQLMKWIKSQSPREQAAISEAASVIKLQRPAFSLPDMDGLQRNISEWDGNVTVVNFWATWCPPCRREMPLFVELQKKLGVQGLQFVGVALDEEIKVQDFVQEMELNYPNLLAGVRGPAISTAYGNRFGALPFTVVIDREKRIAETFRGEVKRQDIEPLLTNLIAR